MTGLLVPGVSLHPLGGTARGVARRFLTFWWFGQQPDWHRQELEFCTVGPLFCSVSLHRKSLLLSALEKSRVLRIYLLTLVLISWVLFAITDFALLGQFLPASLVDMPDPTWFYLRNYRITFVLGFLFHSHFAQGAG